MSQIKCLLVLVLSTFCAVANSKIINCYFPSWTYYRPLDGKFSSFYVKAGLCTHLSYSFFGITDSGEFKDLDPTLNFDPSKKNIKVAMDLKKINPKLKVLAAVGGSVEGSYRYSGMAADTNKRRTFINSTLKFIQANGFDGLEFDWEYPAQLGGIAQDKQNFVTLLKEIKEVFVPLNLELGITVGASENTARISYDIPNIAKHADFINVKTFDFVKTSDDKLGLNAPLKGQGQNNVESAIKYWLAAGAPASKLIMGLAFYGRTFRRADLGQKGPGSPSLGPGLPGPYTKEFGYMGYNEICKMEPNWTVVFDDKYGVPYMYKGNQWISYDNVKSIELKMDFMKSMKLGGVMTWSIDTDDFRGACGKSYPLLDAINRKISDSGGSTGDQPSTSTPSSGGDCATDGFYPNRSDSSKFYQCKGGVRYEYTCAAGLVFNTIYSACFWK